MKTISKIKYTLIAVCLLLSVTGIKIGYGEIPTVGTYESTDYIFDEITDREPISSKAKISDESKVVEHYGFHNGKYTPYTKITTPDNKVENILPGVVTVLDKDSLTVLCEDVSITYRDITPFQDIKEGSTVNSGDIIGQHDGVFIIAGERNNVPFDVIDAYFPELSFMNCLASAEIASREEVAKEVRKQETQVSPVEFDDLFESAGEKYDIDPELLKAVAYVESGFNPQSVSPKGAMGLMQLMPGTAKSLGVQDPFDPEQNVDGGAKYLKNALVQYGDLSLALAAYNAGGGAVKKYGGIPPYTETINYVDRVLTLYKKSGGIV